MALVRKMSVRIFPGIIKKLVNTVVQMHLQFSRYILSTLDVKTHLFTIFSNSIR